MIILALTKADVLDALARFKGLQDENNEEKFVAKEDGKSLMTEAERTKLAAIDTSNYATQSQIQTALTALNSIFGGTYTPPDDSGGGSGDNTGGDTGGGSGGDNTDPEQSGDPDDADEVITDDDIKNLFGK